MILMFVSELATEQNQLARYLDMGIIVLGVVFMGMQARMFILVGTASKIDTLKRLFKWSCAVWFVLEVVLSYWWCYVTGADPMTEHTPFVVLFLGFLGAQLWALRRIGVVSQP
jgi:hypothetical protein